MPPLVSIIIPAYNVAGYLPGCLASFLPDAEALGYEVLLVDDGSADDTGALCDKYAAQHPFVRAIHQENAGQSAARNAAIRAAAGEWLVFVDSDDALAPGALRRIDASLRGTEAPDEGGQEAKSAESGAASPVDLLLYNSRSTRDNAVRSPFLRSQFEHGLEGYLAGAVREYPFVAAPWRYAVRRQFLIGEGLWFHEGIYHEDCEWCPKLLAHARAAAVCEEPLYIYQDAEDGRESTMLSPARRQKRLQGLAAVTKALQTEAGRFAQDPVRSTFLLRSAALSGFQRLLLAGRCGVLEEVCKEDMDTIFDLEEYLPRRFALCVRLVGLKWGVRLYRRIWGDC